MVMSSLNRLMLCGVKIQALFKGLPLNIIGQSYNKDNRLNQKNAEHK